MSLNASSTTTMSTTSGSSSSSSTTNATDVVNSNAMSIDDPFWAKKSVPERCGSGVNDKAGYYVDDRQQVKINLNAYKMVFVKGSQIFYKKNSLRRAKQVRKFFFFVTGVVKVSVV